MARLSFDFRFSGNVRRSYDPAEFLGLSKSDIRRYIRDDLPQGVDETDVSVAAQSIHDALEEARG